MVRSITIKTDSIPELIEVFGENWQEELAAPDGPIPNPQTKADFAAEQFDSEWKSHVKNRVLNYRRRVASTAIDLTEITE